MPRTVLTAVLAAVVTVLVLDLLAGSVFASIVVAHSYDAPRNPNFLRGWPSYTEPRERGVDERLVVVIANSQGFGAEDTVAVDAWPARLAADLARTRPTERWIVANWSVFGGRGGEFVVLGAQAARHRPDLVILATTSRNFMGPSAERPFVQPNSDIDALLVDPAVRQHLGSDFLTRTGTLGPRRFLEALSGLHELRGLAFEAREGTWTGVARDPPAPPRGLPDCEEGEWGPASDRLIEDFVQAVRGPDAPTPVLLVDMPLCLTVPEGQCPTHEALGRVAPESLAERKGVRFLSALRRFDCHLFYDNTHLDPQGAEALSAWLLPHVVELVD